MLGVRNKLEWLATLSNYSGVGLWDAVIHNGDAAHAKSRWTWSSEFQIGRASCRERVCLYV